MKHYIVALFLCALILPGCKKSSLNIFSLQDDKTFGAQMDSQIAADPVQYPLLDPAAYSSSYTYLNNMKANILGSGQLDHAGDFEWKLHIIRNDSIQNAFCTPGGYIYIYTGLIKYLDNASSLAGVLGHEMAHADQRHSTQQMTETYGLTQLLSVALGQNPGLLAQIGTQLTTLAFSRDHEKDADTHSVIYLCPTIYRADGAADFFQKIVASGASQPPAFLSTHPSPDNRISNIQGKKTSLGCAHTPSQQVDVSDYAVFKASLP